MKTSGKEIMEPQIVIVVKKMRQERKRYAFNIEISEYPIWVSFCPSLGISGKNLNDVGKLGKSILQEVFDIRGVNSVSIKPHKLSVIKNYFFEWDEIDSKIIKAFDKCFKRRGINQEIKVIRR